MTKSTKDGFTDGQMTRIKLDYSKKDSSTNDQMVGIKTYYSKQDSFTYGQKEVHLFLFQTLFLSQLCGNKLMFIKLK